MIQFNDGPAIPAGANRMEEASMAAAARGGRIDLQTFLASLWPE